MISFGIGSGLAAAAGTLWVVSGQVFNPYIGSIPAIKAFSIIILGGLGSIPGAIVGGLLSGIAENGAAYFLGGIWKDSISGSPSGHPGQLPPFKSIYAKWQASPPDWLTAQTWVPLVRAQLDVAKAIPNHAWGLNQFVIGQPFWEAYLKGDEKDPKKAMQAAKDAVVADIKKNS